MVDFLFSSLDLLLNQSALANVYLVWPMLLFEVPHYLIVMIIAGLRGKKKQYSLDDATFPKFSVVIVGHNGANNIRNCAVSLREQTCPPDEILVASDGSVDDMRLELHKLVLEGVINGAHHMDLRGGKAAAINLIKNYCQHDLILVCDNDSSLHRHAFKNIISEFINPNVGAVSGNIVPANGDLNILTKLQAMEYLITLTLGKMSLDMLGQISCISGAFGAFRREAIDSVGGYDAGSGEDLDLTLRIRKRGWEVRFSEAAICYTNVPTTLKSYMAQRNRWDGDAIALRFKKHAGSLNPFNKYLKISEIVHQIDFLLFNVLSIAILPIYLVWVYTTYGELGAVLMLAAFILLVVHDFILFSIAVFLSKSVPILNFLPYILLYTILNTLLVRPLRLQTYIRELVFQSSRHDTFVPKKVRRILGD